MAYSMIIDAVLTFHNLLLYFVFFYLCMSVCGYLNLSIQVLVEVRSEIPLELNLHGDVGHLTRVLETKTRVLVLNC